MNLINEMFEKKAKLLMLKRVIEEKEAQIKRAQEDLKDLEDEYRIEQETSLPILLFQIEESIPMPEDSNDTQYENVYYCPDLDEVKYVIEHDNNSLLPNTVDLRKRFKELNVPKKTFSGVARDYEDEIAKAVFIVREKIYDFMAYDMTGTCEQFASFLTEGIYYKADNKGLSLDWK